jgi:hypothetical protein
MAASVALPETSCWPLHPKSKRRDELSADDPVARSDKAFLQAYEKGDMSAVKKLLDADFTWIDTDGVFYSKAS